MAVVIEKLIRDRVPEVAWMSDNKMRRARDDEEYLHLLRGKLSEEVAEFLESDAVEELADIMEVIEALVIMLGSTPHKLIELKAAKRERLGSFERRLVILSTP